MKRKIKSNIKKFFQNFIRVLKRPEMRILPAHLAFYFVLTIVPTITLISYIASLLNISTDVISNFLTNAFTPEIANMLLNPTKFGVSGYSLIPLILGGYYIASNGQASIIITSNAIYGEEQTGYLKRRLKAFVMTFFLVLLFIFLLIVPVFGNAIINGLTKMNITKNVLNRIIKVFHILKGPVTWLIIYLFIKLLYTIAPNKEVKSKSVGYGALFTSIGWIIGTAIYSYYVNNYAHYTTFYGGLANIVILMLWFYFLAFVFTIGMALNYRKEEEELEKTAKINLEKE